MTIACSTLCFDDVPLSVALKRAKELGFPAVELAAVESWAHVSPARLAADYSTIRRQVQEVLGAVRSRVVGLNCGCHRSTEGQERDQLGALCRLAKDLGAPCVTIPASALNVSMEAEVRRLQRFVEIATHNGRKLCLKTHLDTLAQDPTTAAQFAQQVEGLGLTLDVSHFIAQGWHEKDWQALYPFVSQVHLRDAAQGRARIQTRWGEGDVPLESIAAGLRAADFTGVVSVEYISPGRLGLPDNYPLEPEIRAAREALAIAFGSPNL